MAEAQKDEANITTVDNVSGIPGFGFKEIGRDSSTSTFEAFYQPGRYLGTNQAYGGTLSDSWRLFYSLREPIGYWWVSRIADDIWDNGFVIREVENLDSLDLDKQTQQVMNLLKAKTQFPRETIFERRYGTALMVYSYTGQGDWEDPLQTGGKLMQMTPYPWTQVEVSEVDENEESPRFGLPETYRVSRGAVSGSSATLPTGTTSNDQIIVHWTKAYIDAPRLDEHPYLGYPAIDVLFDDLIGGRNARWGMYQGYYRNGQGFPVVKTKGSAKENETWVTNGGLDNFLNSRGYIVLNVEEDFQFVGAQNAIQSPVDFFDTYFAFIAAATGVSKNTIAGISGGRVTGSESDERQYFKAISLQQHKKEPFLRDLIDRLMDTGQIRRTEYVVDWVDPFEVNPQDAAAIEFMEARTEALKTYKTINEKRELNGLPPHDDGDVLASLPGQVTGGSEPAPNQETPNRGETEPEDTEQTPATLLDTVLEEEEQENPTRWEQFKRWLSEPY